MASKSEKVYTNTIASYDLIKSEALRKGTLSHDFLVTRFKNIDEYFEQLKTDDIIQDLKEKKTKGATVKQWSSRRVEGYHSGHLDKAMRMRYGGGLAYGLASVDKLNQSNMAKKFEKDAFQWV